MHKVTFVIHRADGTDHVNINSKKGLFFSDDKSNVVHMLDKNKDEYEVKEYSDSKKSQSTQDIIGMSCTKDCVCT